MAADQRPGRLRLRHGRRRRHPPLPRPAHRRPAGAARPHHDAQSPPGIAAPARRLHRPLRRLRMGQPRSGAARDRQSPRISAGHGSAGLALPVQRLRPGEARPPGLSAKHCPRQLPPDRRRRAGAADGAAVAALPASRRSRQHEVSRPARPHRRGGPLRNLRRRAAAAAAAVAPRPTGRVHAGGENESRDPLSGRGEPRLRFQGRAVESRLLPNRAGERAGRHARRLDGIVGDDPGAQAGRGRSGGTGARATAHRPGAAGGANGPGRRTGAGRRPVHHHAGRPRRGGGAGAGGRRRGAHRHRRLPLVHRLGPRHHDQPGGADALHRPPPRGRLHPPHLRPLRPRRPDSEPLSGGRKGGAVPHRRRHALVLPRRSPLPRGHRRPDDAEADPAEIPRHRRPATCAARASASASIHPTACSARARKAIS